MTEEEIYQSVVETHRSVGRLLKKAMNKWRPPASLRKKETSAFYYLGVLTALITEAAWRTKTFGEILKERGEIPKDRNMEKLFNQLARDTWQDQFGKSKKGRK